VGHGAKAVLHDGIGDHVHDRRTRASSQVAPVLPYES
jgi:hypothetical protein